jgi:hypothetical protein
MAGDIFVKLKNKNELASLHPLSKVKAITRNSRSKINENN